MNIPVSNQNELRIILLEDDDADAKAISRAFQKDAKILNKIYRAVDGIAALEMLKGTKGKEKIPPPYLLLVDLNMPRMNGIEFLQVLRNDPELCNTLCFVFTTSKRDEDMLASYNLNVAGYIVKETAGKDFMNLVSLIDCYWRIVEIP